MYIMTFFFFILLILSLYSGWIIPSNVKPFEPENIDFYCKGKKSKSLQAAIQACLDFCNQTLEPSKRHTLAFSVLISCRFNMLPCQ